MNNLTVINDAQRIPGLSRVAQRRLTEHVEEGLDVLDSTMSPADKVAALAAPLDGIHAVGTEQLQALSRVPFRAHTDEARLAATAAVLKVAAEGTCSGPIGAVLAATGHTAARHSRSVDVCRAFLAPIAELNDDQYAPLAQAYLGLPLSDDTVAFNSGKIALELCSEDRPRWSTTNRLSQAGGVLADSWTLRDHPQRLDAAEAFVRRAVAGPPQPTVCSPTAREAILCAATGSAAKAVPSGAQQALADAAVPMLEGEAVPEQRGAIFAELGLRAAEHTSNVEDRLGCYKAIIWQMQRFHAPPGDRPRDRVRCDLSNAVPPYSAVGMSDETKALLYESALRVAANPALPTDKPLQALATVGLRVMDDPRMQASPDRLYDVSRYLYAMKSSEERWATDPRVRAIVEQALQVESPADQETAYRTAFMAV